jgi:hypothetical protein
MSVNRDRVDVYAELKTADIKGVEQFIHEHASDLDRAQIGIRKTGGMYIADLCPADEPII